MSTKCVCLVAGEGIDYRERSKLEPCLALRLDYSFYGFVSSPST